MNGDKLIKAPHYITSPFGYRVNPVTKKPEGHNGNDYGTNGKKVPCYAVDEGTVLKVSQDRFGANFVYVRYPKLSHVGLYYHLDSVSVKAGQKVTSNTQIGIVGTTGQSTGVHLHFSWIKDNANAMKYYQAEYKDFEKYTFTQHSDNYNKVQSKFGFSDNTMTYLQAYKYAELLFTKMLNGETEFQKETKDYILAYKYGKEIFKKLRGAK